MYLPFVQKILFHVTLMQKIKKKTLKKKSMLGWHFKKYTNMVELHPKIQDR